MQFAEPENDAALVFAQNPHGLGQDDGRQDDETTTRRAEFARDLLGYQS